MGRALAMLAAMMFLTASLAVLGQADCEEGGAEASDFSPGSVTMEGVEAPPFTAGRREEGGAFAPAAGGGRGWVSPDGLYWEGPVRLTDNASEDAHPQVAASSKSNVGVVWDRGGAFMFMRIDRTGAIQINEKQIANGPVPVQFSGYVSPYIGVDSKGCFHITFRPEAYLVAYAKYDGNGNNLIPQKVVPSGASSPHAPSLAVSPNGIVHIVYEDCRFGYTSEAVVYARLLNDGTIDKDGVRISEASWMCSGSTICTDPFNNVHSAFIVKGPSWLGAYHAKLDNFGNPLPQAPPTYLFNATAVGEFESVFPPAIHSDPNGCIHVAWNSNSQGLGSLMYMKLDNNGNILAAGPEGKGIPLTAAATVRGFPSIASDAYGTAYVFWEDIRNGNSQIWYMPLANGHENDTELQHRAVCLMKDSLSTARQPFAARDPDGQLHVVWADNRDGNFEIYHMAGFTRGIETWMAPEEMYKVMYVHPEETRRANLTVRNPGGLNETVHIDLAGNFHGHTGWNVKVEATDFELRPNETRKLWVSVTGPSEGLANDYIDTKLTAMLVDNPKTNSSVAFRSYLVKDSRLRLSCDVKEKTTDAGVPARYPLLLQNIGDTNETAEVSVDGPPDWSWEVSPQKVKLDRNQACVLTLNVTPPLSSAGQTVGVVKVRARLASNPSIHVEVTTTTRVAIWQALAMYADRDNETALPGGTAVFTVTLDYLSNDETARTFVLETQSLRPGLRAELDSGQLTLHGNQNGLAVLSVSAPEDGSEGERLEVAVRAYDRDRTLEAGCDVTLTVAEVRALSVAAVPPEAPIAPGGSALVRLGISNAGNGPETVRPVAFGLPAGWEAELSLPNGKMLEEGWNITLGAGKTAEVFAQITAPAGALAGKYPITARFSDGEGGPLAAAADVEVMRVRSILIFGTEPTKTAEPGDSVRFPLALLNRGNAPEELSLSCRGLPDGWPSPELRDPGGSPVTLVTVPACSEGNLSVEVRVPAATREDLAGLEVLADGGGGLRANASLTIMVEKPDLAIGSVVPTLKYPRPGELVYVEVTVENRGRGTARGAALECHRQGQAVVGRELGDIGPGETRVESFVWIPREGKNVLVFIVDPEDAVSETNETGNTAMMMRYVAGPLPGPPDRSGWMAAGAVAALAVAGALAALYALGRRPGRRR